MAAWRFVLAWIVLSGHMLLFSNPGPWAALFDAFSGKAAVIGFLLVSGFSIAASLERNASGFYRRRLLRIYPLYFFAILFAVVLECAFGGKAELPHRTLHSLGGLTAAGNLLMLQTFLVKPVEFDGPVWSLSIEVFFYFLAPSFARMGRRPVLVLVAISALAFLAPKHTDWGIVYWAFSKFNALNYLWCWLLGFLLWSERSPLMLTAAGLGSVPILFGEATPERLALVTYICSVAMLLLVRRITLPRLLASLGDYLGDLSYPLYLYHFPSFIFAYLALGLRTPLSLLLIAFSISIGAYHFIDRYLKTNYLKPLLFRRRPAATLIATPVTPSESSD